MQLSPVHINYIPDGLEACDGFDEARGGGCYRSASLRNPSTSKVNYNGSQRNSFTLPCDYLDEEDEGNFIVPDPVYADDGRVLSVEKFHDIQNSSTNSMNTLDKNSSFKNRRKKERFRRSKNSMENETLLLQDITNYDVSKGARPKVYKSHKDNGERNLAYFENLRFNHKNFC